MYVGDVENKEESCMLLMRDGYLSKGSILLSSLTFKPAESILPSLIIYVVAEHFSEVFQSLTHMCIGRRSMKMGQREIL